MSPGVVSAGVGAAGVDDWIAALVRVVDRTDQLLEVTGVKLPPEQWSGAAQEAYRSSASRMAVAAAVGQESVRRAARAFLFFGDDLAASATGEDAEAAVRLAERLAQCHPSAQRHPTAPQSGPAGRAPVGEVPPPGTAPEEVVAWWRSLTPHEQEEVNVFHGGGLGGIGLGGVGLGAFPGLPSAARDGANRVALRLDLAREPNEPERRTATSVRRALAADGDRERLLLQYDPQAAGGDGEVQIATGDIDEADRVVVLAPGMTTTAQDAPRYVRLLDDLTTVTDAVVEGSGEAGDPEETASLFWLGYDAPDGFADPATWTKTRATEGGAALADDLAAVQGVREVVRGSEDDAGRVAVVGHSYGSSVVAQAAVGVDVPVDALAFVGSPGSGDAATTEALGVPEVYVGRDSRDPIAALGDKGWATRGGFGLGRDPATDDFGAVRFRAERPDRELGWGAVDAHTSYLDPGSESQLNLARVVAGRPELVTEADPVRDPWWGSPYDPEWSRRVR